MEEGDVVEDPGAVVLERLEREASLRSHGGPSHGGGDEDVDMSFSVNPRPRTAGSARRLRLPTPPSVSVAELATKSAASRSTSAPMSPRNRGPKRAGAVPALNSTEELPEPTTPVRPSTADTGTPQRQTPLREAASATRLDDRRPSPIIVVPAADCNELTDMSRNPAVQTIVRLNVQEPTEKGNALSTLSAPLAQTVTDQINAAEPAAPRPEANLDMSRLTGTEQMLSPCNYVERTGSGKRSRRDGSLMRQARSRSPKSSSPTSPMRSPSLGRRSLQLVRTSEQSPSHAQCRLFLRIGGVTRRVVLDQRPASIAQIHQLFRQSFAGTALPGWKLYVLEMELGMFYELQSVGDVDDGTLLWYTTDAELSLLTSSLLVPNVTPRPTQSRASPSNAASAVTSPRAPVQGIDNNTRPLSDDKLAEASLLERVLDRLDRLETSVNNIARGQGGALSPMMAPATTCIATSTHVLGLKRQMKNMRRGIDELRAEWTQSAREFSEMMNMVKEGATIMHEIIAETTDEPLSEGQKERLEERKQVERHQQDYDQFADAVETQVDDVRTMVELLARDVVQRKFPPKRATLVAIVNELERLTEQVPRLSQQHSLLKRKYWIAWERERSQCEVEEEYLKDESASLKEMIPRFLSICAQMEKIVRCTKARAEQNI